MLIGILILPWKCTIKWLRSCCCILDSSLLSFFRNTVECPSGLLISSFRFIHLPYVSNHCRQQPLHRVVSFFMHFTTLGCAHGLMRWLSIFLNLNNVYTLISWWQTLIKENQRDTGVKYGLVQIEIRSWELTIS